MADGGAIRVLVVDDHPVVRDGSRGTLSGSEFEVVGEAADGVSAVELSPAITATLMSRVRTPVSEPLSAREREVLGLVARRGGNRGIARALFISEATVKTHLVHVHEKRGVRDRTVAVAAAYEQGLLGRS